MTTKSSVFMRKPLVALAALTLAIAGPNVRAANTPTVIAVTETGSPFVAFNIWIRSGSAPTSSITRRAISIRISSPIASITVRARR